MFDALETADLVFWLNATGLTLGIAGAALIYFFGVPRQTDRGGAVHLILEETDEDELARIGRFKRRGNLGLGLIGLAFLLQLAGLIVDKFA